MTETEYETEKEIRELEAELAAMRKIGMILIRLEPVVKAQVLRTLTVRDESGEKIVTAALKGDKGHRLVRGHGCRT